MNGFHEMGPNGYYPNCDGYGPNGEVAQYPESQGGLSEVGFDPVLNYVETLGDELKTPKRRPKQRKEGSSTPHPIITRRASCKSIKSEISAWTEDEDAMSKAESTYVSPETISLKGNPEPFNSPVTDCCFLTRFAFRQGRHNFTEESQAGW